MKIKIISIVLFVCVSAFLLPGCVFISGDFRQTRDMVLDELGPVEIETEVQLQIGPGLLSISRMAVSLTNASDEALDYLRDIRNVQVGVYKLHHVDRDKPLIIPIKIARKLSKKGYEPMVKVKERDEAVWVLTKMHGEKLTSLYVIALDREELVLVEVKGRLGKIVEKAIREHGFEKNKFMGI